MPIPDLDLTVRLVGLPLPELWGRYLAVGGSSTIQALRRLIAGQMSWSRDEELFLAAALSDALVDESLITLDPLKAFVEEQSPSGRQSASGPGPVFWAASSTREAGDIAVDGAVDLGQLIVRAHEARAAARLIRRSAQEARRRATESTYDLVPSAHPLM